MPKDITKTTTETQKQKGRGSKNNSKTKPSALARRVKRITASKTRQTGGTNQGESNV